MAFYNDDDKFYYYEQDYLYENFDKSENSLNQFFPEDSPIYFFDQNKKEENAINIVFRNMISDNTDYETNNNINANDKEINFDNIYFKESPQKENNEIENINISDEKNILQEKIKEEKDEIKEKESLMDNTIIQNNITPDLNDEKNIKFEEKEKNKCGRKKKNDTTNGKHNKNSEDNIINKIKGAFFNFIRDIIKKHSINYKINLKKLPREFISDLNKHLNETLWKMKISEILMNQEISTKYCTLDRYENRKIIEKIYAEKEEINVIKILELTFEELFIIFRRKLNDKEDMKKLEEMKDKIEGLDLNEINNEYEDFEWLINGIKKKYVNNLNEDEIEYIEQLKSLCLGYEDWFNNKSIKECSKRVKE